MLNVRASKHLVTGCGRRTHNACWIHEAPNNLRFRRRLASFPMWKNVQHGESPWSLAGGTFATDLAFEKHESYVLSCILKEYYSVIVSACLSSLDHLILMPHSRNSGHLLSLMSVLTVRNHTATAFRLWQPLFLFTRMTIFSSCRVKSFLELDWIKQINIM